jgi:CHAD domain-containing protein
VLGAARDWDVLGSQTVPRLLHPAGARRAGAGERALLKAIAAHRAACRAAACKALASRRYQQLLIAIARGLEAMEAAAEGRLGLAARAARELERAACRLRIRPRSLRAMDAEQRHRLRIHAKRLRYAVEFLGSLYAGKRVRRYELPLAELQDALGLLNDNAVALSLFSALALPGTALQALQRSLQAGTDEQLDHAVGALRRLAKARPFWTG